MYLHLGADCMVKNSEIIAVFNLRHSQSLIYGEYVKENAGRYKLVDAAGGEEYASLILTADTMYLSSISSLTLKKRAETGFAGGAVYTNF